MIHAQILSGMETIKDKLSNLKPIQLTEMEVNILSAFLLHASENAKSRGMSNYILKIRCSLDKKGKLGYEYKDWVVAYLETALDSTKFNSIPKQAKQSVLKENTECMH